MSAASNSSSNDIPGLEFTPARTGDVVDNAIMAELARRLRLASSPSGSGSGTVVVGAGSVDISDTSGNQLTTNGNGLFVGLGAGLGIVPGTGLELDPDNRIILKGHRVYRQSNDVTTDGTYIFTLPEQVDSYAVAVTPFGDYGAAKIWVSDRNSTSVSVDVDGYTVDFTMEITIIEIL